MALQESGQYRAGAERDLIENIRQHRLIYFADGIILVVLGAIAIALPLASTFAIEQLIGWVFLVGGLVRIGTLLWARSTPGFWWALIGAVVAVVLGAGLVIKPAVGVLSMTLMLAALFLAEGVTALLASLDASHQSMSRGLAFVSGIVDLVLAAFIWSGWPSTAAWVVGLFAGINLIFIGATLIAIGGSRRTEQPG
ncbi:MAG: DUF308 domain-containing protein [Hyphomicrobiaceae bacterium]